MPQNKQQRPGDESEALASSSTALPIVDQDDDNRTEARSRCLLCGHPLTAPRSVSRAYGPHCWTRTTRGQLDARRDAVGRLLARLARRVASLDVEGLAIVAASAGDVLEAIDAEGVTP